MMEIKSLYIFGTLIMFIASCGHKYTNTSNREKPIEKLITSYSIDKVFIGMDINELKKQYANYQFLDTPVYCFGIDGEERDLVIAKDNTPLLFIWTGSENQVNGVYSLNKSFHTDNNLKVGMTIREIKKIYSDCEISVDVSDVNLEYILIPDKKVQLCFMTNENRIGIYKELNAVELTTKEFKSDTFKVDFIAITE